MDSGLISLICIVAIIAISFDVMLHGLKTLGHNIRQFAPLVIVLWLAMALLRSLTVSMNSLLLVLVLIALSIVAYFVLMARQHGHQPHMGSHRGAERTPTVPHEEHEQE
jgi:uncharacterized membrane protein